MGEPLTGDIPDPIYLKTSNVALAGSIVQKKGDWLEFDSAKASFDAIAVTVLGQLITTNIVQLQEDIDTLVPVLADGVGSAAAFGIGSWVYAKCAGVCVPNGEVFAAIFADGSTNRVGFVSTIAVVVTTIINVSNVVTVVTAVNHNLKVGDKFDVAGTGSADDGSTFTVVSVASATSFLYASAAADFSDTGGTITQDASVNHNGQAIFIKVSGATVVLSSALGNIGVFSLLGKGG